MGAGFDRLDSAFVEKRSALVLAAFCLSASPAGAACHASMTNINFGTVTDRNLLGATATGTITEGCGPGYATRGTLGVCNKIGSGQSVGGTRAMYGAGGSIGYQLYYDAAMTQPISTNSWSVVVTGPYSTASGSADIVTTVYAKITSVNSAGAGAFRENYSIYSNATLDANYPSGLSPCAPTLPINGANVNLSFSVSVNVVAACTVSASPLVFPTSGSLSRQTSSTATISTTCTAGIPYTIGLGPGQNGRKMVSGGSAIYYDLYRDAAHSQSWGDRNSLIPFWGQPTMASLTGTGSIQTSTVYGLVPGQLTPPPGLYRDLVVVTVTY
ncbi:Csu type fimbrial protein [Methylocystis echinoides]|uniref:Spore coat protein U n=1 Tax=Methylocystis echinoides TaxID=29468 RepID=A0A9W6GQQ9_9HYPH|nr:spore coat U domain-containing protein [Methylocystis echinoides]GLI91189.1 spore coat protein U [Methylocystis echinoides]